MKMIYSKFVDLTKRLQDLGLLLLRLVLAYGFYKPAMLKLKDIHAIGDWFAGMNYPFPYLNAYMATITESLGVILLALGLGTRIISIPLMVVMLVAIFTVHWGNGFDAGDNGFEIPLYYLLILFTLLSHGAGKYSADYVIGKAKA